jgi:hypothetical protein
VASNFFSAVAPWQAKHFDLYNAALSSWELVRAGTEAIMNVTAKIALANTSHRVIETLIIPTTFHPSTW